MWGQECKREDIPLLARIIPTRVGTSVIVFIPLEKFRIIPTRVGTRYACIQISLYTPGSSPRVWGQDYDNSADLDNDRIIPTRVGTRVKNKLKTTADADHPHACGDKTMKKTSQRKSRGSSPRVWGQELNEVIDSTNGRIIPTRVGTSRTCLFLSQNRKDHPHACGDKSHLAL